MQQHKPFFKDRSSEKLFLVALLIIEITGLLSFIIQLLHREPGYYTAIITPQRFYLYLTGVILYFLFSIFISTQILFKSPGAYPHKFEFLKNSHSFIRNHTPLRYFLNCLIVGVVLFFIYMKLGIIFSPFRGTAFLAFLILPAMLISFFSNPNFDAFNIEDFSKVLVTILFMNASLAYFANVSNDPFSIGWSEGSGFYYASLYFSKSLYGEHFPLGVLDPAKDMLHAIPFLFTHTEIWIHRLWSALLWVSVPLMFSFLFLKKYCFKKFNISQLFFVSIWVTLFLYQAPIYFHLLLVMIIVLLIYRTDNPQSKYLAILIGSIWAGLCRINWFFVPGTLVVLLDMLFQPQQNKPAPKKLLLRYAVYEVLGFLVAFGTNRIFIHFSGNSLLEYANPIFSQLIWERLFPNFSGTFTPGVLLCALLVLLPMLIVVLAHKKEGLGTALLPLEQKLLAAMMTAFFVGGLVVSARIGGGNNIHNMDIILIFSLILFLFTVKQNNFKPNSRFEFILLVVIFFTPLLSASKSIAFHFYHEPPLNEISEQCLQPLQREIDRISVNNGKILFIEEKQLITFGNLQVKPVISDYELVELMEMTMAENPEYLAEFKTRLENKDYAAIITRKQPEKMKGKSDIFGEENDLWFTNITLNLNQYYPSVEDICKIYIYR